MGELQEYDFTLILHGSDVLSDEILNKLFEAGCDDGTFSVIGGKIRADFTRKDTSSSLAVASAIVDVLRSGAGLKVWGVESDFFTAFRRTDPPLEWTTAEEIAAGGPQAASDKSQEPPAVSPSG